MNKFYLLIITLFFTAQCTLAQNAATPNPGFENWTQVGNHFDPNNWNTLNPSTSILGVFTCTRATGADVHSGTYAIKLTTKSVFGVTANGVASTAALVTTPPYGVTGGIPYTGRPDSIVGWYKYNPASAIDSGFAEIVLFDAVGDTVGFSRFTVPNTAVTTYTRFSRPVNYYSTNATANSYWILSSSDGANPVVNSSLYIDDLDFIFNTSGVNDVQSSNAFTVTNSITDGMLTVKNNLSEDAAMNITDESGRIIKSMKITTGENSFDLQALPAGIYFYQLFTVKQNGFSNGKLIKL
jgi:hypothetical protein